MFLKKLLVQNCVQEILLCVIAPSSPQNIMFCSIMLCKSTKSVEIFQGEATVLIKSHKEGELGERTRLEL